MSAPNPNTANLRVVSPQQSQPAPAAAPQPEPQRPVPLEDRTLTPEETESLLRGIQPEEEPGTPSVADAEQASMAQEWIQSQQRAAAPVPQPQPQLPPALPPQAVQQIAAQPSVPPPAPQVQPPVQVDPQVAALQAQNSLLQSQIQAMMVQMQQAQQAPQQAPRPAPQQQQQQPYTFNVPDQYLNALRSEDANVVRSALNGLLNGVAEVVRNDLRSEMNGRFASVPQDVQEVVQAHARRQEIQQDMYGTYPELAGYRQYVQAAAQQLGGNLGVDAWTPDLRDAIAERVAPIVPGLYQKVQQIRASRLAQGFVPQPPGVQQPGVQPPIPTGYAQPVGGVHGGPVYVRDAAGNLVPYQPQQQFVAGQQTRPGGRAVDPAIQDIWSTLGF